MSAGYRRTLSSRSGVCSGVPYPRAAQTNSSLRNVSTTSSTPSTPPEFAAALETIRRAQSRPELVITEIPAPGQLAPYAVALAADVRPARHGSDSDLGTGRFILLYDPDEPEAWGGRFRVVCFAQAPLETDIGLDPFLADVAWSWLVDALDARARQVHRGVAARRPRSSRPVSANWPSRATARRSSCAPRGPRSSTTSPHTSKAGANCSACSPACPRPARV